MCNVKSLIEFLDDECLPEQDVYFYDEETDSYYMYNVARIDSEGDVVINIFKTN